MENESRPERGEEKPPFDTDSYRPHTYTVNPTRPFEFFMDSQHSPQSSFQLAESAGLHPSYIDDPNVANPIKDDMIRRVLGAKKETNLSFILDLTKLVQFSDQSLELTYADRGLVGYDNRTGKIYFTPNDIIIENFKRAVYERGIRDSSIFPFQEPMGDDEFNSLLAEINDSQVESDVKTHVKESARSNLEAKTSLETTQLRIDEELARQYHDKISFLESKIRYLETHPNEESQRQIDHLKFQLEDYTKTARDEITKLEESLQLRETQLLETQKWGEDLEKKKNAFEEFIQSSEQENENLARIVREQKKNNEQLEKEKNIYKKERDNLDKALKSIVDSKTQEISNLAAEIDKLQKQGKSTSSLQESIQKRNKELKDALDKLQTNYDARLAISKDQEKTIKQDKKNIQAQAQKIASHENELKRLSFFEKRAQELESLFKEQNKIIRSKQEELDNQKLEYEEKISSLTLEKSSLAKDKSDAESQLKTLESEIQEANQKNKAQLKREKDSKLSQVQQYDLQIKNLNTDINVYRNKIQSLEKENQALKESSLETSKDYSKQLKDIKKKIHDTETKPLQEKVKDLQDEIIKYKLDLDKADKSCKSAIQKYKEEALKLNNENRKLTKELKDSKSSTRYDSIQKDLMENMNKFTKLQRDYNSLLVGSGERIEELTAERDALKDREKDAIEALQYRRQRIEAMTKNAEEYKKQVEDLEKQIDDANNKIELNKVKQIQYDKLTSDYNLITHDLQKAVTDREVLKQKLQEIAKERDELQKKIVPDDVINQLKHDVEHLNRSLDEREAYLKKNNKHLQDAIRSEREIRKAHEDLKANFDARFARLTTQSERKLKALRDKLKQTLRPADIKAIGVILSKVGDLNFENVDYDQTRKEIISAIKRYDEKSKDPKTPHANKFLFDEVKKHFQKRLDLLNLAHGRDVETIYGNEQILQSSEGIKGLLLKLLRLVKKYKFTIAFTVIWGALSWSLNAVLILAHGAKSGTVKVASYLVDKAVQLSPAIASIILGSAYLTVSSLQWFTKHVFEIFLGGIGASVTLVKLYGEEFSFPIFAFWSLVGAYTIIIFSKLWSYVPDFIKK